MGNCLSTGERPREEADLNPLVNYPGADNLVISEPPPSYEFLLPAPIRPPAELSCRTYVANCDYESCVTDHNGRGLSFKKGDLLFIIGTDEGNWWYAQHKGTHKVGYVPSSLLAPADPLEEEEWYFGKVNRTEASKMLLRSVNSHGSYMVRDSGSCEGDIAISVRYYKTVRHFLIKRLCTGAYYIARRRTFESIPELIEYYQQQAGGLGVNLKQPCVMEAIPADLPSKEEECASADVKTNCH